MESLGWYFYVTCLCTAVDINMNDNYASFFFLVYASVLFLSFFMLYKVGGDRIANRLVINVLVGIRRVKDLFVLLPFGVSCISL